MDPKKFKLGDAVQILLDRDCPVLSKTWTLARLMAWMCLDQRRGTRKRNPKTGRPIRANRQRRDAKLAGHLALASILDRRFKPGQFDGSDEVVRLLVESGGFRPFLESTRGGRRWLPRMRKATDELAYVHQIVNYLCRCAQSQIDENKRTVQCAKIFVEKTDKTLKRTALGNRWEKNRQAAPYIFAFYENCSSAVTAAASIDQFVDMLEQLATNQQQLNQLLGHTAYAADILAKTARKVRLQDFKDVQRAEPQCTAFSVDELEMIKRIDPGELSKKDDQHYSPKIIPRSKPSCIPE